MADIGTFPTIRQVINGGKNLPQFTATTAVKAGQVVAIHATGVSGAVDKSVKAAGSRSVGVAMYDAGAGANVAVLGYGTVAIVANADDTTAIDAGGYVETNDNTVGGTVNEADVAADGDTIGITHYDIIGIALDTIAGGGTGRILVCPMTLVQLNAS